MRKLYATAIVIAACAALCAAVLPQDDVDWKVPADAESRYLGLCSDELMQPTSEKMITLSDDTPRLSATECAAPEPIAIKAEQEEVPVQPLQAETASPATRETPVAPIEPVPTQEAQSVAPASDDPYHTDVYPNNVYSEELIYDADGNLVGKTITYPTAFGTDTIWIHGRAYYDLPGFGLVEWGGPSQRTENYTMYESGVKVGIMGGEDEVPAIGTTSSQSTEPPVPIDETVDQTINATPGRNSTPPDYKPDTAPPDDPNARNVECP